MVVWLFVVGNAAAIVFMWVHAGRASGDLSTASTAQVVLSSARITGLLGAYLALLEVVLLARLPWLERLVGFDRLTIWHRWNGHACLYLILAHTFLSIWGYQLLEFQPISYWGETARLIWGDVLPGMVTATVGTGLLVLVVVTSVSIARRRLSYEFWYAVHLLTYAAVLTAIPHQFSVGGLFAEGTWQRWYWLAICIGTGAVLAHYRVLEPLVATVRHQLTVSRVIVEAPGVVSIELTGRHLDELAGTGGRFFIWRFLTPGMWWHPHPFSLSAEPVLFDASGRGRLRITVRNLGRGSAQLARLKSGTRVAIEGPYGLFTTAARSRNRVVMIGAGIGITPIRALLERTPFEPGGATVVLRGHSGAELYLGGEILELCRRRDATLFHLTGARSTGEQSWLPESAVRSGHRLASYAPDIADADVYICGPSAWARSVITEARAAGVREEQLHYERFDW